jgi:hypothetical protein
VSRCPVTAFVSSLRRGEGLTRKRPDEIEERHRLENGRSNGSLAEEADNVEEREHYIRLRDAWITFANRCEFFAISDVADE